MFKIMSTYVRTNTNRNMIFDNKFKDIVCMYECVRVYVCVMHSCTYVSSYIHIHIHMPSHTHSSLLSPSLFLSSSFSFSFSLSLSPSLSLSLPLSHSFFLSLSFSVFLSPCLSFSLSLLASTHALELLQCALRSARDDLHAAQEALLQVSEREINERMEWEKERECAQTVQQERNYFSNRCALALGRVT